MATAKRGVLTFRQAAYFAEIKGPSEESVRLLAGLAVAVRDNKSFSEELALSALAAAKAIDHLAAQTDALVALAPHLAPEQLGEALAAAKAIRYEGDRWKALAALIARVRPAQSRRPPSLDSKRR